MYLNNEILSFWSDFRKRNYGQLVRLLGINGSGYNTNVFSRRLGGSHERETCTYHHGGGLRSLLCPCWVRRGVGSVERGEQRGVNSNGVERGEFVGRSKQRLGSGSVVGRSEQRLDCDSVLERGVCRRQA